MKKSQTILSGLGVQWGYGPQDGGLTGRPSALGRAACCRETTPSTLVHLRPPGAPVLEACRSRGSPRTSVGGGGCLEEGWGRQPLQPGPMGVPRPRNPIWGGLAATRSGSSSESSSQGPEGGWGRPGPPATETETLCCPAGVVLPRGQGQLAGASSR